MSGMFPWNSLVYRWSDHHQSPAADSALRYIAKVQELQAKHDLIRNVKIGYFEVLKNEKIS